MAIRDDLDSIYNLLSPSDRSSLDAILNRPENEAARTALIGRETVYRAFAAGDENLQQLQQVQQQQQPQQQQRPTPASLDLAALDAELVRRTPVLIKSFTESPEFLAAVKAQAKAITDAELRAAEGPFLGRSAHLFDEIYTVRRTHEKEFGEELNTVDFDKYMSENRQFKSVTEAHNAYVHQKRMDAAIAKGVREGLAAAKTSEVPGTSLPNSHSQLGVMMRDNAQRTGAAATTAARGAGLDAAVQHFRELRAQHVN